MFLMVRAPPQNSGDIGADALGWFLSAHRDYKDVGIESPKRKISFTASLLSTLR